MKSDSNLSLPLTDGGYQVRPRVLCSSIPSPARHLRLPSSLTRSVLILLNLETFHTSSVASLPACDDSTHYCTVQNDWPSLKIL